MIYLLDTDHISLIHRGGPIGQRIESRLLEVFPAGVFLSIISFEEQTRGWFAELNRNRSYHQQEAVYAELARLLDLDGNTPILQFNAVAIAEYHRIGRMQLRVGTMDLKIAAIAIANDATLLTRNISDFDKVPELRIEDWSL